MADRILTACAGFLLAVLWMDLIFDTQIRRRSHGPDHDEAAVASIAGYYRRATTTSRPMSTLIAVVMGVLVVAVAVVAVSGARPAWFTILSAVLGGGPVLLALLRTVPNAVRLGARADPPAQQIRVARAIYRDHIICLLGMTAFLVLWLLPG